MRQTAPCDHLLNEKLKGALDFQLLPWWAEGGGGGGGGVLKILSDRDHVFMWASNKAQ